jgi:hypothetical protein
MQFLRTQNYLLDSGPILLKKSSSPKNFSLVIGKVMKPLSQVDCTNKNKLIFKRKLDSDGCVMQGAGH